MRSMSMFLAAMDAQYVQRYHADSVRDHQTVGAHTYGVMVLVDYVMDGEQSRKLMRKVLLHDVPEVVTGDMPYTAKRNNTELRRVMDAAENAAMLAWGEPQIVLNALEQMIYKFCDLAEAGFHALREIQMGNTLAIPILEKVIDGLSSNTDVCDTTDPVMQRCCGIYETLRSGFDD